MLSVMLKKALKSAGKNLLGNNPVLTPIAGRYLRQKKYFSAALFTLYTFPLRSIINPNEDSFMGLIDSEDYYRELHELLRIDSAEGFGLVRTGRGNDGGYILLDDLPGGIAY